MTDDQTPLNPQEQLLQSFAIVDQIEGNKGFIDRQKIKKVFNMYGIEVTAKQVRLLTEEVPEDQLNNYDYAEMMARLVGDDIVLAFIAQNPSWFIYGTERRFS